MSNPIATPLTAAIAMMNSGVAKCSQTPNASTNAQIICAVCVQSRIVRLGCRSASEPPQMEKIIIGAEPTAATVPRRIFELVIS